MKSILAPSKLSSINILCMSKGRRSSVVFPTTTSKRKRPRDNLDMLITLTLYKLARPLSGAGFCLCDQIHFKSSHGAWLVKTRFSNALSSNGIENVSETPIHALKPDYTNAPYVKTIKFNSGESLVRSRNIS